MICEAILMGRTYFIQDPPVFQRFMLITFYLLTLLFLKATTDRMYTGGSPILVNRWLSTSILTSELGEGAFPSNLLSKKPVATAERTIGEICNEFNGRVQFRGGGTMHGPKPQSPAFKPNRKVRRLGLKISLTARAAEGKLLVFDDLEVPTHKTKNLVNYVKQMENTKKLRLVDGGPIGEKLKLATQNLHYANVLPSIGLNVYSILLYDTLVVSHEAVNKIVERMHTPINR